MHDVIDLNAGSGFVYGGAALADPAMRLNALIDSALVAADRAKPLRDYLGASRIGEPCARRLAYEITRTPKDDGREFGGRTLRVFDVGHHLEDLCVSWLRSAGFDVRTRNRSSESSASRSPAAASAATSTEPSSTGPRSASPGRRSGSIRQSVRRRGPRS